MNRTFLPVLLITLAVVLFGCSNDPYNNTTSKNELITQIYSESICEQIQYRISVGGLHIDGLKEIVDVECLRKTENGSYAILKLNNGKFAYIIIDENDMCICVNQSIESFPTRADIESILEGATDFWDVYALSLNAMYAGESVLIIAVYPVQEGYVATTFINGWEYPDKITLKSMEFYEDISESPFWEYKGITQILDVDRKAETGDGGQ